MQGVGQHGPRNNSQGSWTPSCLLGSRQATRCCSIICSTACHSAARTNHAGASLDVGAAVIWHILSPIQAMRRRRCRLPCHQPSNCALTPWRNSTELLVPGQTVCEGVPVMGVREAGRHPITWPHGQQTEQWCCAHGDAQCGCTGYPTAAACAPARLMQMLLLQVDGQWGLSGSPSSCAAAPSTATHAADAASEL
jgi:hypothetical protein